MRFAKAFKVSFVPTTFRPFARGGFGGRGAGDFRGLIASSFNRGQVGTKMFRSPGAFVNFRIAGITKDSTGSNLGFCRVELFLTASDTNIQEITSDAVGAYTFETSGTGPFYLVAYKAGSPDVAGTTVNTIMPKAF